MKQKTLKNLLSGISPSKIYGKVGVDVTNVADDSRKVKEGGVFVAWKGIKSDGHDYIENAIEKGVKAIVAEKINRKKLVKGILKACEKRPVELSDVEKAVLNGEDPIEAVKDSIKRHRPDEPFRIEGSDLLVQREYVKQTVKEAIGKDPATNLTSALLELYKSSQFSPLVFCRSYQLFSQAPQLAVSAGL